MNVSAQHQLATELTRNLAPEIAPYELLLFAAQREAYLTNPEKILKNSTDSLAGVTYIVPVMQAVLKDVIHFITKEIKNSFPYDSANRLHDYVKQLFHAFRSTETTVHKKLPYLTPNQIIAVRELAFEQARFYRLSRAKAHLLADTVASSLVVKPTNKKRRTMHPPTQKYKMISFSSMAKRFDIS